MASVLGCGRETLRIESPVRGLEPVFSMKCKFVFSLRNCMSMVQRMVERMNEGKITMEKYF